MKLLSVATIVSSYQLQGFIKVKPFSIYADLLFESDFILLSKKGVLIRSLKLEDIREYGKFFLVKLFGVTSKEEADTLKGYEISLPEKVILEAKTILNGEDSSEDEIFWKDIEGSDVLDESGKVLGQLVDYVEAVGSTDVFRIRLLDGSFALISHNPNHVLRIDEIKKQIVVNETGIVLE